MRAVQIRCKDLRKKEYKSVTMEFNNYYHYSNWFDKFSKHYKVLGMEWLDGGDSRDWTLENASWEDNHSQESG